jgi:hypothetical protein
MVHLIFTELVLEYSTCGREIMALRIHPTGTGLGVFREDNVPLQMLRLPLNHTPLNVLVTSTIVPALRAMTEIGFVRVGITMSRRLLGSNTLYQV